MKKIYIIVFFVIISLLMLSLKCYAGFADSFFYKFNLSTNDIHPGTATNGQKIWCRHKGGKLTRYDGELKYYAVGKTHNMNETLAGWLYEVENSKTITNKNGRSGAIQTILWEQNGKSNNKYNFSSQKISLGGILREPNKQEIEALKNAKDNINNTKKKVSTSIQEKKKFELKNYDGTDTIKSINSDKAILKSMNLLDGATSNTDCDNEDKIVSFKSGTVVDGSTYVKEGNADTKVYANYYIMENVPYEWYYNVEGAEITEDITDIILYDENDKQIYNYLKCAWKDGDYIDKVGDGTEIDLSNEENHISGFYSNIKSNEGFKIYIPKVDSNKKELDKEKVYKIRIMTSRGTESNKYAKIVIPFKIDLKGNETFESPYKDYWILNNVKLDWTYDVKNGNYNSYIEDIQLLDSTGKIACQHLKFYYQTGNNDPNHGDDHINCVSEEDEYDINKNFIKDCYSDKIKNDNGQDSDQSDFRIYIPKDKIVEGKTYKIKIIHTYVKTTTYNSTEKMIGYSGKYRLYKSEKGYDRQAVMSYEVDKHTKNENDKWDKEEIKENNVKIKIKVKKDVEENENKGNYVKYLYGVYKKGEEGLGGKKAANKEYGLLGQCTKPKWDITTGECVNLEDLQRPKYINGPLKGESVVLDENAENDEYVLIYKMQFFAPEGNSLSMSEIVANYNKSIGADFGTQLVDKFTDKSLKLMEINRTDKENSENKEELDWKNYISPNIQFNVEGKIEDTIPEGATVYVTNPDNVGQWTINEGKDNNNGAVNVSGTTAYVEITRTCNNTINAVEGVSPVIEASDEVTYETDATGNIVNDDYGEPKIKEIKDEEGNTIENNGNIKDSNGKIIGKREVEGNDDADKFAFIYCYTPQNDSGIKQTLNVSSNPVYVGNNPMNISGKIFLDGYDTSNKVTQSNNGVIDDNEKWTGDNVKVELFRADYDSTNPNHYDYSKATSVSDTLITKSEEGTYSFEELDRNMYNPDTYMPPNYNGYDDIQEKMSQKISYIVRFLYNGERYETTIYEAKDQDETRTSHAKESDTGAYSTLSNITRQDFNTKIENGNLRKTSPVANNEANNNSANESIADYDSIYEIDATTPNGITEATSWKEHVNLGVVKRNFDLCLENKLVSMDISINGVKQTIPSINGGIITETISNQDIKFIESDYNYTDNDKNKELSAWVHYKITVRNESLDNYKAIVNGINLYYDNSFTEIKVNEGYTTTQIQGYGDFNGINISCGKLITNSADSNTTEFNIDMKLTREKIAEIINGSGKTLETIAEISGYNSYYTGDIYNTGRHKENDVAGKLDEDSVPSNIDMNTYISNIRNTTDSKTLFQFFNTEDDARRALGIKLVKEEGKRKIEGRVFEDATKQTKEYIDGNKEKNRYTRLGNGKYNKDNDKDKNIEKVKVELIDSSNNSNVYNGVETNNTGVYSFDNVIPSAKYIIQFTYGNGETKQYNCQDYKSTIDTTGSEHNATIYKDENGQKIPNAGKENYWYANDNLSGKSVAKDIDMKISNSILNNSIATKLENYNINTDDMSNKAKTKEFFVPITEFGDYNNKNAYTVSNMNLGIAERPRSELTIKKEVDHLTITTSDGRVLIDGKQKANSTSWTDRYVQAIVDENLVYGSTLKITYKYTVENTGEVNYTDEKFYNYGIKGNNEVTTSADKIIDYVDNKLMYDENMQANPDDANKQNKVYWKNAGTDDLELLETSVKDEGNNVNTKLVSEKLTKALKPGDKTDSIYLTLSKVLSSSEDKYNESLVYNNYVEIIQSTNTAGRRSYSTKNNELLSDLSSNRGAPITNLDNVNSKGSYILTIPGDLNPTTLATLKYEPDSDKAQEIQIVPPFGNQKLIWIIIGTTAAIILVGGIYLIKKKVL